MKQVFPKKFERLFSKYYNEKLTTATASGFKAMFEQLHSLLNNHKTNKLNTWKVLEAPPQLNLRQRLTLLSFSRISKVPSFHLVVPRSMPLRRILTAPPLESLGTMVAMAYYPVGALWRLGLAIKQILNKPQRVINNSLSMFSIHSVGYKCQALTISVPPTYLPSLLPLLHRDDIKVG